MPRSVEAVQEVLVFELKEYLLSIQWVQLKSI
jgi:hypothetical protein